jgi:hypothetical protein
LIQLLVMVYARILMHKLRQPRFTG